MKHPETTPTSFLGCGIILCLLLWHFTKTGPLAAAGPGLALLVAGACFFVDVVFVSWQWLFGPPWKPKLRICWTCSDYVHHEHRWRWAARLCAWRQRMRSPFERKCREVNRRVVASFFGWRRFCMPLYWRIRLGLAAKWPPK